MSDKLTPSAKEDRAASRSSKSGTVSILVANRTVPGRAGGKELPDADACYRRGPNLALRRPITIVTLPLAAHRLSAS